MTPTFDHIYWLQTAPGAWYRISRLERKDRWPLIVRNWPRGAGCPTIRTLLVTP